MLIILRFVVGAALPRIEISWNQGAWELAYGKDAISESYRHIRVPRGYCSRWIRSVDDVES